MVCAAGQQDYIVRLFHYLGREQHLRRDDHRPQDNATLEGRVRYGHQGGGQRHAGQGRAAREGIVRYDHQGGGQRQAGQPIVI